MIFFCVGQGSELVGAICTSLESGLLLKSRHRFLNWGLQSCWITLSFTIVSQFLLVFGQVCLFHALVKVPRVVSTTSLLVIEALNHVLGILKHLWDIICLLLIFSVERLRIRWVMSEVLNWLLCLNYWSAFLHSRIDRWHLFWAQGSCLLDIKSALGVVLLLLNRPSLISWHIVAPLSAYVQRRSILGTTELFFLCIGLSKS